MLQELQIYLDSSQRTVQEEDNEWFIDSNEFSENPDSGVIIHDEKSIGNAGSFGLKVQQTPSPLPEVLVPPKASPTPPTVGSSAIVDEGF